MNITGGKLYVAAVWAVAVALRADIANAPIGDADQATAKWILAGIIAGLGTILGPELIDGVKTVLGKLAGKEEPPAV